MTSAPAVPSLVRTLTQEKIGRYAEAVGDYNPIHVDEAFARGTPFGGTIAHGMLVLAYASDVMGAAFGAAWARSGRLRARFKAPARPGDVLTLEAAAGRIREGEDGRWFEYEITCRNQNGETLLTATAAVAAGEG